MAATRRLTTFPAGSADVGATRGTKVGAGIGERTRRARSTAPQMGGGKALTPKTKRAVLKAAPAPPGPAKLAPDHGFASVRACLEDLRLRKATLEEAIGAIEAVIAIYEPR